MLKILEQLLEAGKIDKEVATQIDSDLSGELKKVRDEAANYRVELKTAKEQLENAIGAKDGYEKQIESLNAQIEKAKEDGKSEVLEDLQKQKAEHEKLLENIQNIEAQNRVLKIDNALSSALSSFDVIDKDVVSLALKHSIDITDDGVKFKDGENILSLEDGLKSYFESKPQLLKSQGGQGSGATGSNESGSANFENKKFSELSLDEKTELYKKDKSLYEKLKGK